MDNFWIEHRYSSGNYKLPYHYEYAYQALFVLTGKILYQVGEKKYEVARGEMIVLNTLEEHSLKVLEYPYERYVFQINTTFFQNEVSYPEIISVFVRRPADFSHKLSITEPVWNYLYEIVVEMEREYLEKRDYWEMFVGSDLRRFFLTVFRECADLLSSMKVGSGIAIAYQIMNYLDLHYTEDISIESIANSLFLNKHYVAHVFKKETGRSLISYVIALRMNRAKLLLVETDKNISDVATECGYTDFTYFSRLFKKNFGVSPSKFRKTARRDNELAGIQLE